MGNLENAIDMGGRFYTQAEIDSSLAAKANTATTLSGYGITDAYTETEVDNLLATKEPADATILKQADIGTSVLAPNGDGSQLTGLPEGYTDANANAFDLGVGQTWQDMTASRSSGVTYTNTTGKPIMVAASGGETSYSYLYAYVDGLKIAVSKSRDTATSTSQASLSFIVQAGLTYKVNSSSSAGNIIDTWAELR